MAQMGFFDLSVKWSGKLGHCAKMYPTRMNGYENDEATELFGQVLKALSDKLDGQAANP